MLPDNLAAACHQAENGQEWTFKIFLHCYHSPETSCRRHTSISPVRTIIAYAGSLPVSPLNE